MSNCCANPIRGTRLNTGWGRIRCSMGSLRSRIAVYNDNNSACESPFAPPTNLLTLIDYFPVSYSKLSIPDGRPENDKGKVSIVCDVNQNLQEILTGNKFVLVDIDYEQILAFGRIQSWERISATDADINFLVITAGYKYEQIFIG